MSLKEMREVIWEIRKRVVNDIPPPKHTLNHSALIAALSCVFYFMELLEEELHG